MENHYIYVHLSIDTQSGSCLKCVINLYHLMHV